jgi:D-lactate dehydrogenase
MHITLFSAHAFERSFLQRACDASPAAHTLRMLDAPLTLDTASLAQGSDAVCLFVNDDGSAPVLERLAALGVRFIALRSAGYNHLDLPRAAALGLAVAYVPAYSPYAVAEHALALMMALNRKLIRANSRTRELNFSLNGLVGFDMHGKTVGVIGTGQIGAVLCRILHGLGCHILASDPCPDASLSERYAVAYTDLDALCARADIISLHAPLTAQTKYLIDAHRVSQMKRGVMLVNTSRGGLLDTRAVIAALKTGHIGYLGLDVYENEKNLFFEDFSDTILQDDVIARLLTFPNVLITSHQAFLTQTALQNIADATFDNINAWAEQRRAPHTLT